MRSALIALRAAGVAVTLTAVSAVTAPLALAGEDSRGSVSANPSPAQPGSQVKLRVSGCDGRWATAKSAVFVSDVDLSHRDDGGPLFGDAMISSHAEPGWYDIRGAGASWCR